MRAIKLSSLLAAVTLVGVAFGDGNEKLLNLDFENDTVGKAPAEWHFPDICAKDGYSLSVSDAKPFAGKKCVVLKRDAKEASEAFGNMLQSLDATPYRGKRVRFKAAVRAQVGGNAQAMLWLRVDRAKDQMGFFDNMSDRPIREKTWKHYEIVGDVADDAQSVTLGMLLIGNGEAAIDDASFEVVDKATVKLTGPEQRDPPAPGLIEAVMAHDLMGSFFGTPSEATLLYPLPLAYRDQVPLTFELTIEPPAAGKEVAIVEGPGDNRILKLSFQNLDKHKKVSVSFRSLVLMGPTRFDDVPKSAPYPASWPVEVQPWLASTWCADHENERVKKVAMEIRGDSNDVMEVIAKVVQRSSKIIGEAKGRVSDLTAVEALDKQGSCTSCANLVAALLRGAGIPARILAGYPLWSGPLQTHYIVEAYVPGYGWYPIESTMGKAPWANHQQVAVSVVPIENECKENAGRRTFAAGAVPYLSLTECDTPKARLGSMGTLKPYCDHGASMIRTMNATDAEWADALKWAKPRWQTWLASKPELKDGQLTFGPATVAVKAKSISELRAELK